MLKDNYNREINYLRVSLTDKCNLRCIYCLPKPQGNNDLLTKDEIIRILKVAISLGINKIRLTGGEPLLRGDIDEIIKEVSTQKNLQDLSLTTNGVLLSNVAKELKSAGLKRINVSLDTLDNDKFKIISGSGKNLPTHLTEVRGLHDILCGIKKAKEVGFEPVKINVVLLKGINDDEIFDFINFAKEYNLIIRFIELMPTTKSKILNKKFISREEIISKLKDRIIYKYSMNRGDTASYFRLSDGIDIGIISPVSCNFCSICNRLRITSDGKILSCLTNNYFISLKKYIRDGADDETLKCLFYKSVSSKPKSSKYHKPFPLHIWQIGG